MKLFRSRLVTACHGDSRTTAGRKPDRSKNKDKKCKHTWVGTYGVNFATYPGPTFYIEVCKKCGLIRMTEESLQKWIR